MNKLTYEQYNGSVFHNESVAYVGHWSALESGMKTLSRERIQGFSLSLLGFSGKHELAVSHAAITELDNGVAVVGGYLTVPDFRGYGYGHDTLEHLLEMADDQLQGVKAYQAFVNPAGRSQFEELGFEVTGMRQPPAETGCNFVMEKAVNLQEVAA